MSALSHIPPAAGPSAFGSTRYGTSILPDRATNASRRGLPLATLWSTYGSSSSHSVSRTRRQYGDPSKLHSSSGLSAGRDGTAARPWPDRTPAAIPAATRARGPSHIGALGP